VFLRMQVFREVTLRHQARCSHVLKERSAFIFRESRGPRPPETLQMKHCGCVKYGNHSIDNRVTSQTTRITNRLIAYRILYHVIKFNLLMPNDLYMCPTAPLTSRCYISYIYSTNIGTEYFKHAAHCPFSSLQSAVCFIMLHFWFLYYSHFTYRCTKIKKQNSGAKRLINTFNYIHYINFVMRKEGEPLDSTNTCNTLHFSEQHKLNSHRRNFCKFNSTTRIAKTKQTCIPSIVSLSDCNLWHKH
jgi:hypothetical protein